MDERLIYFSFYTQTYYYLARNNEKDIAGIVLNAFSEPFILDKEIWDIVENMKSRIQE